MKHHELKTDPAVFAAVIAGTKTHEIRFNDRDYMAGDVLHLRETRHSGEEMSVGAPLEYTGRHALREVSHIQAGYGLHDNWVILSFATGMPTTGRRKEDQLPTGPLEWGAPDALYPAYVKPEKMAAYCAPGDACDCRNNDADPTLCGRAPDMPKSSAQMEAELQRARAAIKASGVAPAAPVVAEGLEAIQWRNIRHVVNELAKFCFGNADHPEYGTSYTALVTSLTAKDGLDVRLEPLAAHPVAGSPAEADGNWPEDFQHENGNYENKCSTCGCMFLGHKRRFTCKRCAEPMPASEATSGAHHLTPESIAATIADLRAIEDGTTERPIEGRDWRTWAGVLARIIDHLAAPAAPTDAKPTTYSSTQATMCVGCGKHKHTPLRIDAMGGYVCLTCIDNKLGSMLGEFGCREPSDIAAQSVSDALERAAETCEALVDNIGDAATYDQREMYDTELERMHTATDCAKAIRALIAAQSVRDAAQPTPPATQCCNHDCDQGDKCPLRQGATP